MTRTLIRGLLIALALLLVPFVLFALAQRERRASYQLRKEVLALLEAQPTRAPLLGVEPAAARDEAERAATLKPPVPLEQVEACARGAPCAAEVSSRLEPWLSAVLELGSAAPFAPLPGLSSLGARPASLEAPRVLAAAAALAEATQQQMLREGAFDLTLCLQALALARDASLGGGTQGLVTAAEMTRAVLPGCAGALDAALYDDKRRAAEELEGLLRSAPSLPRALREGSAQAQLEAFAGRMREEDVAALPATLLQRGEASVVGFLEGQRAIAAWSALQKVTHRVAEAFTAGEPERDEVLARELLKLEEGSAAAQGLLKAWRPREAIAAHGERLLLLRLLHEAALRDVERATEGRWGARSAEALRAGITAREEGPRLLLELPGPSLRLVVTPDAEAAP